MDLASPACWKDDFGKCSRYSRCHSLVSSSFGKTWILISEYKKVLHASMLFVYILFCFQSLLIRIRMGVKPTWSHLVPSSVGRNPVPTPPLWWAKRRPASTRLSLPIPIGSIATSHSQGHCTNKQLLALAAVNKIEEQALMPTLTYSKRFSCADPDDNRWQCQCKRWDLVYDGEWRKRHFLQ